MENYEHTLVNGDEISIEKIQNNSYGKERYLIKSKNDKWDMFTYTPDGNEGSDQLAISQKLVIEEISHLF
jgi:hypothetical protein